jgi:hypothetical protein
MSANQSQLPPARLTIKGETGVAREMTLDEWVAKLPNGHRARRDLVSLEVHLAQAQTRNSILAFALFLVIAATIAYLAIQG